MKFISLCVLYFILCCAQPVSAKSKTQLLDSLFNALYSDNRFNGNVLIAERGKIIYQKSFGMANDEAGEQLNANSIFELASVAKQFTAMAIVILKEEGKLFYDDDLTKYIPALAQYKGVTIRQLLYHNSGIPDYMHPLDTVWDKSKILTNEALIDVLASRNIPLLFQSNTQNDYSNTGYALLATIIEKASGQSYSSFMKERIFMPLHMQHTYVATRRLYPVKVSNYAYGYVYSDSLGKHVLPDDVMDYRRVYYYDGVIGHSNISSTAPDLLKWDRALYKHTLVSKKSTEEIFTSGKLDNGKEVNYGFGWMLKYDSVYGRIAAHTGGWPGYVTFIERDLDSDKTVIILENHFTDAVLPFKEVRKILYNQPLPSPRKQISLPESEMTKFIGDYQLGAKSLKIFNKNHQLKMQIAGQRSFSIYPESESKFFLKELKAEIVFAIENKRVSALTLYQNDNQTFAKKIEP